jgi:hypothetical protein
VGVVRLAPMLEQVRYTAALLVYVPASPQLESANPREETNCSYFSLLDLKTGQQKRAKVFRWVPTLGANALQLHWTRVPGHWQAPLPSRLLVGIGCIYPVTSLAGRRCSVCCHLLGPAGHR